MPIDSIQGRDSGTARRERHVPLPDGGTRSEPPYTVLIAEDEAPVREAYRIWLSSDSRWNIREAADGEEALEKLDETVDILVLDRNMPKLSGAEVVARLNETPFEGEVIAISAYEPDRELSETDVATYVTKPAGEERFVKSLEELAS